VTESIRITDNADGVRKLLGRLHHDSEGIMFFGLLDFDEYGHRKDPIGYARALEDFDTCIPDIIQALRAYDVLVFTADHGTDPTCDRHTHTREYVPLLAVGPKVLPAAQLGIRETFADLGQTIADILCLGRLSHGQSFASALIGDQPSLTAI
jgi:phosphopentomutase